MTSIGEKISNKQLSIATALLLFILAFSVRVINIEEALYGDELATLHESKNLGTNLNGIGFFAIYRVWIAVSQDFSWLRLLPIIFGSLSVALCYLWLSLLRPYQIAFLSSALLAISPVAVEYSQQVRFYAFAMLTAMLFLLIYAHYWRYQKVPLMTVLGAAILVPLSFVLGALLIGVIFAHWLLVNKPRFFRVLAAAVVIFVVGMIIVAIANPSIFQKPFQILSRITPLVSNYDQPRGWSPIIAAKISFLAYHIALGQYTYPLDSIVAILFFGTSFIVLTFVGMFRLYRNNRTLLYLVLLCIGAVCFVYFVLDPIMPAWFIAGANVRLVIWIVPIALWMVAEGIYALEPRRLQVIALVVVISAQLYGLWNMATNPWGKPNYTEIAHVLAPYATQSNTLILADGRAYEFINFNLRQPGNLESAWNYTDEANLISKMRERSLERLVMVSADFREANRCQFSTLLSQLSNVRLEQGFVDYPFFIYAFDLTAGPTSQTNPVSAFEMRYQDIKLPQVVAWSAYDGNVMGAYTLPNCQGQRIWRSTTNGQKATQIVLLSNTASSMALQVGAQIARLTVVASDGKRTIVPILYGVHTQSWDASASSCSKCESVLRWHKRAALVGSSAYQDAYRDFTAHIWGTVMAMPEAAQVESIELELLHETATLNIWGVAIR